MAWFERPNTAFERTTFIRLREVYQLLKRWRDAIPELKLPGIPAFEHEKLEDALGSEETGELLERLTRELRVVLHEWGHILQGKPALKNTPAWGRVLRVTEDEAVSMTSFQWKDAGEGPFKTVPEVFAAYRETPLATLFKGASLTLTSRPQFVEFIVTHPAIDLETAWMRGFLTVLRPQVRIQLGQRPGGVQSIQWAE